MQFKMRLISIKKINRLTALMCICRYMYVDMYISISLFIYFPYCWDCWGMFLCYVCFHLRKINKQSIEKKKRLQDDKGMCFSALLGLYNHIPDNVLFSHSLYPLKKESEINKMCSEMMYERRKHRIWTQND